MSFQENTIWSRLVLSSWRREFRCPEGLEVTNEEFAARLATAIQENRIPAEVTLRVVSWDSTSRQQARILVRYTGSGSATDVLRYLVGIDQMGRFTYVEEKTYFAPPDLPYVPREKRKVPRASTGMWIAILVAALIHFLIGYALEFWELSDWLTFVICKAPPFVLGGIALFGFAKDSEKMSQLDEVTNWNRAAESETRAREKAWDDWQSHILTAAYSSRIDDTLGRFVEAVRSTVSDVTQELFTDRNAELVKETEQETTREEIEAELKRRREEAFG